MSEKTSDQGMEHVIRDDEGGVLRIVDRAGVLTLDYMAYNGSRERMAMRRDVFEMAATMLAWA